MAFVRTKRGRKGRTLLQLVESRWERGKVRQPVLAHVGSYPADCSIRRAAGILWRDFQRWRDAATLRAAVAESLREGRRVPPPGRHAPTWVRQYHRARGDVERYLARMEVAAKRYAILRAYCREEARASRAEVRVDIAARDGQVGPRASRDRRVRQPLYPTDCRECGAAVIVGITPDGRNLLLDAEPSATASGYALVSGGRTPRFAPTTALPAYRPHWDVCPAVRPAGRRRP